MLYLPKYESSPTCTTYPIQSCNIFRVTVIDENIGKVTIIQAELGFKFAEILLYISEIFLVHYKCMNVEEGKYCRVHPVY